MSLSQEDQSQIISNQVFCEWIKYSQTMYSFGLERVRCFDCSPDGKEIAVGFYDEKTIQIYYMMSEARALADLNGHDYSVYYVKYSPDCKFILSGSDDGTIKLWDRQLQREYLDFSGPELLGVGQIRYSPNGDQFATCHDRIIRIWCCMTGNKLQEINLKSVSELMKYTNNGQGLIVSQTENASIWDIRTKRRTKQFIGNENDFHLIQTSANGAFIVFVGLNGFVQVRSRKSGKTLRVLNSEMISFDGYDYVNQILIHPKSQKMASIIQNKLVTWDLRTVNKRTINLTNSKLQISQFNYSPDGRYIIAQTDEEDIYIQRLFHAQFKKE